MRAIFSELTQKRIDDGLDWLENYKGIEVILVNQGLKPDVGHKVTSKGFVTYEPHRVFDHLDLDLFNIINHEYDKQELVYVQKPELAYDLTEAWESKVFFADLGDLNIDNLVFPITSINKRVELGSFLEKEILEKYDFFFDSCIMGGPTSSWQEYFSLYKSLIDCGMIEHTTKTSRDLCLNLFAAFFPERFKHLAIRNHDRGNPILVPDASE